MDYSNQPVTNRQCRFTDPDPFPLAAPSPRKQVLVDALRAPLFTRPEQSFSDILAVDIQRISTNMPEASLDRSMQMVQKVLDTQRDAREDIREIKTRLGRLESDVAGLHVFLAEQAHTNISPNDTEARDEARTRATTKITAFGLPTRPNCCGQECGIGSMPNTWPRSWKTWEKGRSAPSGAEPWSCLHIC